MSPKSCSWGSIFSNWSKAITEFGGYGATFSKVLLMPGNGADEDDNGSGKLNVREFEVSSCWLELEKLFSQSSEDKLDWSKFS
jgi:hypothetical protein